MPEPYCLFDISQNNKSKNARLQIIDGFIEILMMSPDNKPSVKEIMNAVGVARSTFYTYFDSVDDLYQSIITEFIHCSENFLLHTGDGTLLVDMLTKWFEFCRANRELYVALSNVSDQRFTNAMAEIWRKHLEIMMDYDGISNDMFRALHFEYIPRSNELMTYAWLTKTELKDMPAKVLAQIINNQRLNYVSHTSVQRYVSRRPLFSPKSQFVCSEVVSIKRMQELLDTGRGEFLHRQFTDEEILQAEKSILSIYFYAQFYAAKRAISERICGHVNEKLFKNISIVIYENHAEDEDEASVSLSGEAAALAEEKNINTINLSTAYEADYATAFVIVTM